MSLLSTLASRALAQGTVSFRNRDPAAAVSAFVFLGTGNCPGGDMKASGPDYVAMLLAGPPGEPLTPASPQVTFGRGALAGVISGGTVTISNIPPGGAAAVQVVAWDRTIYPTYPAARDAGFLGSSIVLQLAKTGDPTKSPPSDPAPLLGLQTFYIPNRMLSDALPCYSSLSIVRSNAFVTIRFPNSYVKYHLEEASDLSGRSWQAAALQATNFVVLDWQLYWEVTVPLAQAQRYYRLIRP